MIRQPRPELPACPRCGIEYELRWTVTHFRKCDTPARRDERRAKRAAERAARDYFRRRR